VIKFLVAIFKDLTFWVEKFNFKLVKTSLFSVATNEKNMCQQEWQRQERAAYPS
jgi:hypothetical protein